MVETEPISNAWKTAIVQSKSGRAVIQYLIAGYPTQDARARREQLVRFGEHVSIKFSNFFEAGRDKGQGSSIPGKSSDMDGVTDGQTLKRRCQIKAVPPTF